MSEWPKVAYLFKGGRRERMASGQAFPTEFFYGMIELSRQGKDIVLLDEDELSALGGSEGTLGRLLSALAQRAVPGLPFSFSTAKRYMNAAVRERLNSFEVLIATTQTFGLVLALLKRLGLLRPRVIFIAMGALSFNQAARWQSFVSWLLGAVEVAPLSEAEVLFLRKRIPRHHALNYLPFGIDTNFWTPRCEAIDNLEPYILSIGNDWNRDFKTLIEAWRSDYPRLMIITQLPISADDRPNVTICKGSWRGQDFSDSEIRSLYQGCLFAIIPLRQTIQPAGQSACLQIMACGKAVILSEIAGIWDRKAIRHEETCLLVPPGSIEEVQSAVQRLLSSPDLVASIEQNAREVVVSHFGAETTSRHIKRLITMDAAMNILPAGSH